MYDLQEKELVNLVETEEEKVCSDDDLIENSSVFEINSKVQTLVQLISSINEICKMNGKNEIFKMTTKVFQSTGDLFSTVAVDQQTFTSVVSCLCIIIYEGSGKDNLRFLTGDTAVLQDDKCEFIWSLKDLRNKWTLHDADHGKQTHIDKKWKKILESLQWLGLKTRPYKEDHYKLLHKNLLLKAEEFLFLLASRLENI